MGDDLAGLAAREQPARVSAGCARCRWTGVGRDLDGVVLGPCLRCGEQPAPVANTLPAVWDLTMADMRARDALGRQRYGTPLQPHNGRDALRDAYEEALDLSVYLRQAIYERDGR